VSIVEQIPHVERLLGVDQEIRGLTEQMEKEQAEIGGAKAELAELKSRLVLDRDSVTEMERTRQELTKELRNMEKQIERSRERLSRARNEREAQAAEREMDELRKLQRDRDEEIKKIVALADQARASIEESEKREQALESQIAGTIEGATRSVHALQERLDVLKQDRNQLLAKLPKMLARRYESLRARRPMAVARAVEGVCMGCHIELPPMMYHEMLAQTRFEECPHCHRIIYYSPPSEAAPKEGAGASSG
jgi:predicted  nucleic acid-binding Zn-ribbon protein